MTKAGHFKEAIEEISQMAAFIITLDAFCQKEENKDLDIGAFYLLDLKDTLVFKQTINEIIGYTRR